MESKYLYATWVYTLSTVHIEPIWQPNVKVCSKGQPRAFFHHTQILVSKV